MCPDLSNKNGWKIGQVGSADSIELIELFIENASHLKSKIVEKQSFLNKITG